MPKSIAASTQQTITAMAGVAALMLDVDTSTSQTYSGAIANDGTRNLVGRIDSQEMTMFDVIADGDVVVFQEQG